MYFSIQMYRSIKTHFNKNKFLQEQKYSFKRIKMRLHDLK